MEFQEEFEDAVCSLREEFVKDYYEKQVNLEKIGDLIFKYKDTYGLCYETSETAIFDKIDEDMNNVWKSIVKGGLAHFKELNDRRRV